MLFCIISNLHGQESFCGTFPSKKQLQFMSDIEGGISKLKNRNFPQVSIPVKFFIIRRSDGTGGLAPDRPASLINEVNQVFAPANMSFFEVEPATFVDDDNFFALEQTEENALAGSRDIANVINIYISGPSLEGGSLCGYTRFPPDRRDRVFMASVCASRNAGVGVTAHELGHYFSLFHTHGVTNNGVTDELVARVNCDILGDRLCDTPADPNLTGMVNNCVYVGTARDANGELFMPETGNYMTNVVAAGCGNFFTDGQYDRLRNGFENGRSNLSVVFLNFRARLSSNVRLGCAPLRVQFFDETQGGTAREWQFEGGDIENSLSPSPVVLYEEPGTYSVTLKAFNAGGAESEVSRTAFITVLDPFRNLLQEETMTSFEGVTIPDNWEVINEDQLVTFVASNVSFDEGSGSIFLNNFEYGAEVVPQIDDVELSSFDLNEISSIGIDFNYSYSFRVGDLSEMVDPGFDTLEVGYRVDCSDEFFSLFRSGGEELSTVPGSNDAHIPSNQSQWRNINISVDKEDIPNFDELQVFRPTIRNISSNGNNLYIDNIRLVPDFSLDSVEFFRTVTASTSAVELRWSNPANNETGVVVERSVDGINFSEIVVLERDAAEYTDNDIPEGVDIVFYRVVNTNSRARSSFSEVIEVPLVVTSTNDLPTAEEQLTIFPNPSISGSFSLKCSCNFREEFSSLKIYDLTGSEVIQLSSENMILGSSGELSVDLKLEAGIYLLKLSESSGQGVETLRLLVN